MRTTITIGLAFALLIWSVTTLVIETSAGPYHALAERLEAGAGKVRQLSSFAHVEEALGHNEISALCSREFVRSTTSIRLAILDAHYQGGDAEREAALGKARDALTSSLRCFPRDGNLWLRLAMIEYAREGATSTVQEMLKASFAMAPSEAWIMIPRITFASQLLGFDLKDVHEIFRADVQNLAAYGQVDDVAEVYTKMNDASRDVFAKSFATLSKERLEATERAIASSALKQRTRN